MLNEILTVDEVSNLFSVVTDIIIMYICEGILNAVMRNGVTYVVCDSLFDSFAENVAYVDEQFEQRKLKHRS